MIRLARRAKLLLLMNAMMESGGGVLAGERRGEGNENNDIYPCVAVEDYE